MVGQHGPTEPQLHHRQQHGGVGALEGGRRVGTPGTQCGVEEYPGGRPFGWHHPWAPTSRVGHHLGGNVGGGDDHHRLLGHRRDGDVGLRPKLRPATGEGGVVGDNDGQVQLASLDRPGEWHRGVDDDVQRIARQPPDGSQGRSAGGHRSRVDEPQPVGARKTVTKTFRKPPQIGGLGQHPVGLDQDLVARRRQHPAPPHPFEQLDAEAPFQLGDSLAERRLGDPEFVGGLGPAGGAGSCLQVAQLLRGQ